MDEVILSYDIIIRTIFVLVALYYARKTIIEMTARTAVDGSNAMVLCAHCRKEISRSAKSCLHCGAKKPRPFGIFCALLISGMVVWSTTKKEKYTPPPPVDNSPAGLLDSARIMCKQFVKEKLHDPDSAEFEDYRTYYAKEEKGIYKVQVHLRATNAFNAKRKVVFECKTMPIKDGKWVVFGVQEMP